MAEPEDRQRRHNGVDQDRARMDGRVVGQANRYAELPDDTRKFFESLRPDDVARWEEFTTLLREKGITKIRCGVEMAESAATLGKWSKWIIVSAVTLFAGVAGLMASLSQIMSYFKPPSGGGHP